ncbi:MAG TPA: cytochrome P450 [Anaerolineae bacterium]|nr:cytochrome P450 [Anaerolineae bacterium]
MTQTMTIEKPAQTKRPLPPVLPAPRWMGWTKELTDDVLGLLTLGRETGDFVRFRVANTYIYLANHPDYIKHILQDNNRNYGKATRALQIIKLISGENIFTSEGEFWLKRRRLMQPTFHRQHIASFGTVMTGAAQEMLAEWDAAPVNHVFNIDEEMMRVTLKIVGRALFSVDLTSDTRTLGKAFSDSTEYMIFRIRHPFYPPMGFPTLRNRRAKATRRTLENVIQRIIRERVASGKEPNDLLTLLLSMRDEETGEGLTEEELGREISTMVFAGHETTSNTLTWAWYLLSLHPEVESGLHQEIDKVLNGRVPTMDDVPNLVYTRQVIDESIRLYPPAWTFGRVALKSDELGGYRIPAGAQILISPYTMHRHPRYWENPDVFEPERFSPTQNEKRPRFVYLPFGGGPRLCIGQPFALAEATLLLAAIAQRYSLRLVPNAKVIPFPQITLGVAEGMPMTLTPR